MPYATARDLDEFITYLHNQVGQPYLWGGQHTRLTPSNYIAVIDAHESDPTNAANVKAFCRRKFNDGATELFAYDCSGLGIYFWYNIKNLFANTNADGMMRRTYLSTEPPKRGWWLFNTDSSGRAYHVGYMINDTDIIQAYGRTVGVIKNTFHPSDWSCWGIPNIFEGGVVPPPGNIPGYTEDTTQQTTFSHQEEGTSSPRIEVVGKATRRVNVRRGPSTKYRSLFTARGGQTYELIGVDPETGWYKIQTFKGIGYITNKTKYTRVIGG